MKLLSRLGIAAVVGTAFVALVVPAQAASAHAPTAIRAGTHQLSCQDRHFLVAAHQGNLAEIAAGHLALARSHDSEVRHIANVLISDHTRLDAAVAATAAAHHVALPATPSRVQREQLEAVSRRSGRAFDRAWLKLQELSHLQTLALIDQELAHGRAADVKATARSARPVVKMHLDMVRAALGRR